MKPVKIAFVSRVDYGSDGFRLGLLNLAADIFRDERVDFVVWAGGVVYHKALEETRRRELKKISGPGSQERKDVFRDIFQGKAINFLAHNIPRIRSSDPGKQWMKQYLVTSPAYDGDLGHAIVAKVAKKRGGDLVHWDHGFSLISTQESGRDIAILTPPRATWLRGKYDSTPVERVMLDWRSQHNGPDPYLLVVGCFGNHIVKPGGGQWNIPVVSIPSLCSLRETRTGSENQVGVVILELTETGGIVTRLYPFNHLLVNETRAIKAPRRASDSQKEIVEILKENGPQTIGLFAHHLGLGRNRVGLQEDLNSLRADQTLDVKKSPQKDWPGIVLDEASGRYSFDPQWIQQNLPYALPKGTRKETSLVAFGCMHAGCVHTNYTYISERMPEVIIERKADVVFGAGDFVEGLRHFLDRRGEVMPGMNNDDQQKLAGQLVAHVLLEVFKKRSSDQFVRYCKSVGTKHLLKKMQDIIEKYLPTFVYIPGNHCCWVRDDGFHPLRIFRSELVHHLAWGIHEFLEKKYHPDYRWFYYPTTEFISKKVIEIPQFTDRHHLSVDLDVAVRHPWLSNTTTASIRSQQLLGQTGAEGAISANYHTALFMARHDGQQRFSLQVGTLKDRSAFEHEKLKNLDTGVGALKLVVVNGVIVSIETTFDVASEIPSRSARVSGDILCDELGIKTYPMH